ncbi:hypothetical protein GCM10008932_09690 [Alkalibacterium iburiense]|uniref:GIY-YIG domain-containing protein n=1 Tax=Alkalibacterium iburiense TaxID=290589 RepID=A0ABP3H313_9LACT
MKKSYFYVLYCKDGTLYGGYTTDIKRRLKEHNDGIGAKYTRPARRRPARMLYAEAHASRSLATKAEAAFKKMTRPVKERYLKDNGVKFPLHKQHACIVKEMESNQDADSEKL